MYQQPNTKNYSSESLRRLSSNNPFRQYEQPMQANRSANSVSSNGKNSNFDEWIQKNKQFLDLSDDDEPFQPVNMNVNLNYTGNSSQSGYNSGYASPVGETFSRPEFPTRPSRTGSDSSVNYGNKMSSNNPFAAAMQEPTFKHRDPPPIPRKSRSQQTPPRPPKGEVPPPPSYEEAAGRERLRGEYPQEKQSSSRYQGSSRAHRSHSDGSRPRHEHSRTHKDKERRSHKSKSKSPRKKPEPVKSKNMDTIDKLDVTGFFGGGFHHDGPFDACTPHRNKNVKAAPVMAFPVDGPNNSIKGSSAVNKNAQVNLAFGNYADQNEIIGRKPSVKRTQANDPLSRNNEDKSLYVSDKNPSVVNFSANSKAEPIHGSTTAGLGSSTFVDGAPAPRINDDHLNISNGGLSRKKSIVSRLRKNSNSENNTRRPSADADIVLSNKTSFGHVDSDDGLGQGSSLLRRVKSLKVRR